MAELYLRRAYDADAASIRDIHVSAWRETHAGTPQEGLAEIAAGSRTACWNACLADPGRPEAVFLIGLDGEAPAGFAACGPVDSVRLRASGYAGEFYVIYLRRRLQRRGAGRALMQAMTRHLLAQGIDSAGLWVLRDSHAARAFYGKLGAQETGIDGVWPIGGLELPDLALGWRDISTILAHQ